MTDRMLYSERTAYERMGPTRQALHRVLRRAYRTVPLWDAHGNGPRPWAGPFRALWRAYRRTWPSI